MWSIYKKPYRLVNRRKPDDVWGAKTLMDWIADYCNILVPGNAIVKWEGTESSGAGVPDQPVYGHGTSQFNVSHVIAYVSTDKITERQYIQIAFELEDQDIRHFCRAPVLGNPNEAWLLAQRIAEVLNDILMHDAIPAMVGMYRKLAGRPHTAVAVVARHAGIATVTLEDGTLIDKADFGIKDPVQRQAAAWCTDWAKVLRHAGYGVQTDARATLPDLAA